MADDVTDAGLEREPTPAAPPVELVFQAGSLAGSRRHFRAEVVTLGRRSGMDVRADAAADRQVSGVHARLFRDDQRRWCVEDLGSTNGTAVNGARLQGPRVLAHGDLVVLGGLGAEDGCLGFRVQLAGAAAAAGDPPPMTMLGGALKAQPDPREPAAPARGPAAAAAAAKDDGFLGLGRIKGRIRRFMDRRELQKQLEADRQMLWTRESAATAAARNLGAAWWRAGGRPAGDPAPLQAYGEGIRQLERQQAAADADAAVARGRWHAAEPGWQAEHERLREAEAALSARQQEQTALVQAARTAVEQHTDPRDARLQELAQRLAAWAGGGDLHGSDRLTLEADLAADLRQVADMLTSPPPLLGPALRELELARKQLAGTGRELAATHQALADHDGERQRIQAEVDAAEQRCSELQRKLAAEVEQLALQHAGALASLGREALDRLPDGKPTPDADPLPEWLAARKSTDQVAELQARIQAAEAELAALDPDGS